MAAFLVLLLASGRIELSTRTVRGLRLPPARLLDFLATPANWPRIVLSSVAVEGEDVHRPLRRGESVDEIFGAPPVLPLSVTWTCERRDAAAGILDVRSADGLPGLADDCRMLFTVSGDPGSDEGACGLELRMSYAPLSPLARLAVPLLAADNWLALNVFLPLALRTEAAGRREPLADFRRLMGALYGLAGGAHAADCLAGSSELLARAGIPAFAQLPSAGQAVCLLWCAAGPAAFALSTAGGAAADAGLLAYGVVEVGVAALAASALPASPELAAAPLQAVCVQLAVLAAWLYSSARQGSGSVPAESDSDIGS